MKKFPGCQFGPMQVRGAIRGDRVRGERVVGWATGRLGLAHSTEFLVHGLMHVPGVQVLAFIILANQQRFIILTDRRVLILPVEREALKRSKRAVSIPLGEVALSGWGKSFLDGTMSVRAAHAGKTYTLQIKPRKKSRPWSRLIEGLRVLAADADSPPTPLS